MYPQMQLYIGYSHHFKTCPVFNLFKHTLTPQIPGNYQSFFCLCSFDFSRFLYNWNHKYVGFSDWPLSLSDIHLQLIHIFCGLMKVKVKVAQSCPTLCDPMDYTANWILQARILEWVAFPFSRGSSQVRDQTRPPALQVDSLPTELPGNLKNTGVGSLSLLQGIFPTQESNRDLLHCKWIFYQLN